MEITGKDVRISEEFLKYATSEEIIQIREICRAVGERRNRN